MQQDQSPVDISAKAAKKLLEIIEEEGNPNLMLRIFVQGGGCSGFQYGFALEEQSQEDDSLVESNGVRMLVDPMSLQYLQGAKLDYKSGFLKSEFIIDNPNATSTCSCGSSFSG